MATRFWRWLNRRQAGRLREFGLTRQDLGWLPRVINVRVLVIGDSALIDTRSRRPFLFLTPWGDEVALEAGTGSPPPPLPAPVANLFRLFLLSVRAVPLGPEACLLREDRPSLSLAALGVVATRTGALLSPTHQGLIVTDHLLIDRSAESGAAAAGVVRRQFSLVRGLPEAVLARSHWYWLGERGGVAELDGSSRSRLAGAAAEVMGRGHFPAALGVRPHPGMPGTFGEPRAAAAERTLDGGSVYLGTLAVTNPILPGLAEAVARLSREGVSVLWESRLPVELQRAIALAVPGLQLVAQTGREPGARPAPTARGSSTAKTQPGRGLRSGPAALGQAEEKTGGKGTNRLFYLGRQVQESAVACLEWSVVRLQAFPDGTGRLFPLGWRHGQNEVAGGLPRSNAVPSALPRPLILPVGSEGNLLSRFLELYELAHLTLSGVW